MNLPKDWEAIANDPVHFGGNRREAVERCYALASKPKRGLTDAEISAIFYECTGIVSDTSSCEFARAIEAAIWAKQREPETVTFRAARHPTAPVSLFRIDADIASVGYEWLDVDGKPQTFEVKV